MSCIINLFAGSIYAWSVFASPLAERIGSLLQTSLTSADLAIAFSIANALGPIPMIFGGLINALAISLCLFANATSGGTDFIAIFLSEKYGIDSWNYIFAGNVVILGIAGALFGWDKALYSIIFQYTSTQVLHVLYKRYQKQTLIIVTKRPEDVYEAIAEITNHDATLIKGEGCYSKQECDVLYSVVGRDEVNKVVNTVRKTDPQAFVNMIRTENLAGRFYQRPND